MQLFSKFYERVMTWVQHRHAPWFLGGLSFAESCVLPFPPPDVMLAPMSLANTKKAWRYAALTTITSVLGGIAGYLIGMFAFELIRPALESAGYMDRYNLAVSWFEQYGIWMVLLAGFSPVPYKLFTIAAGVASMVFLPFVLASFVGRGARFFLVASLMVWGGEKMDQALRRYVDRLGWAVVALAVAAFIYIEFIK